MANVSYLADKARDATMWTPRDALADGLKAIDEKEPNRVISRATKLLVIALDDTDGMYDVGFIQAGMSATQMIALLEILKLQLYHDEMGG